MTELAKAVLQDVVRLVNGCILPPEERRDFCDEQSVEAHGGCAKYSERSSEADESRATDKRLGIPNEKTENLKVTAGRWGKKTAGYEITLTNVKTGQFDELINQYIEPLLS